MDQKIARYAIVILIACSSVASRAQNLKIGTKAPVVAFETDLAHKQVRDFYAGKFLVLDFWATWCAPCIASFPKLNALNEKFSSDKIVFAAITNESEEKVNKFFAMKKFLKLELITLIDLVQSQNFPEGKTFTDFKISTLPYTVIIAPDQTLKWVGTADGLTGQIIEQAISSYKPVHASVPTSKPSLNDTISVNGFKIATSVVEKANNSSMLNTFPEKTPIKNFFKGAKIDFILGKYHQLSSKQIKIIGTHEQIPIIRYSMERNTGSSWDSLALVSTKVLASQYGFSYKVEKRMQEVWELELKDLKTLTKNATPFDGESGKSGTGVYDKKVFAINQNFSRIIEVFDGYYPNEFFALEPTKVDSIARKVFDFDFPIDDLNKLKLRLKDYGIAMERKIKQVSYLTLDFSQRSEALKGK